ncbi:hypothetical protein AA23498_2712 [Acetobacter nitrogenifigens DSM 23921 = NBRC 105050]|uniref:Plasmid maintenance toxin (PemK-like) n=1 Tax=Acetobacter nitrogenifigens DSM 23921 = NBRC 105050 TaxID=1120919 RepID=A0A511XEW1_9PROT|nr:hypothetical protein [Acetobacter nitrogenifigens]GBQ96711.1 hypothetical protein AA23498_2712 [Acetobacter nitrogenifigens DSM 23921 = NBRC 105050]GEN61496.1 hypothetical protein ANI02nite_33800 [Acetobacter nitrogenifigens DSM 23921 = NBRC 105050]
MSHPSQGAVIRYSYLWADENAAGAEEGRKDRPTLVLALSVRNEDGLAELLVLAITHSPPRDKTEAVPLPKDVKRLLGLDDAPSWIVTTEANYFIWPGPDLRPIPGRKPPGVVYGHIPAGLLSTVARSYLTNRDKQKGRLVRRTE